MTASEEELGRQLDENSPEVRVGQVWHIDETKQHLIYPYEIRIVTLYPFAQPDNGRLWVVEQYPGALGKFWRIPELSLRLLYDMIQDAP